VSSTRLPQRDDPVERVASIFAARGWEVTSDGSSRNARHPEHGRVIIARWALGLRAQLWIERVNGVWAIPAFCGLDEENRICDLIGISPDDLWSRDIFADELAA
jgi:hypothetical protein